MDIFDVIKEDHKQVLDIIDRLEDTSSRAGKSREQLYSKLKDEVLPHMHAEETLFYPLLLEKGDDKESVFEALEEHRAVRLVMSDVESVPVTDEQWKARLKVMGEMLENHIYEEEDSIFDMAEDIIDDQQAEEMVERFQSLKKEAKVSI